MKYCDRVSTPMEQDIKLTSNEGSTFEDQTKYMKVVGSLIFLTTTHPNIDFVVGILSRYMCQPYEGHWIARKWVLSYLKDTHQYVIKYFKVLDFHLIGYSNFDFDGDKEHGVSIFGYLMNLRSKAINSRSQKKYVLVDSTTEAKYIATTQAIK